jgi:anthranilate/para-aminobenzoate synthase component I
VSDIQTLHPTIRPCQIETDFTFRCIALRTMVYKDGIAYLQAGGGIVYDSDSYDE